jgi:2-oxoglutarate dehydrogenase E2 component (dihydrolipoamide succinyltransferase)
MQHDVLVPSMGESIVSGLLSRWSVADGERVHTGQPLYELETDKITSEGAAEHSGVIRILVEAGQEVKIGQCVARIDASEAATTAAAVPAASGGAAAAPAPVYPNAPSVTRIAAQSGLDPATVEGSGKGGRVTKADMLQTLESRPAKEVSPVAAEPASPATKAVPAVYQAPAASVTGAASAPTRTRLSPIRKRIAERLLSAQQQAAILTTFNEVDMTAVMGLRKSLQEEFQAAHGVKLGFMSFFVKAVVQALKAVPAIHARIEGDEWVQYHHFDIGVAVGTEKGLVVPVLNNCDQLGFGEIEKQLVEYARRAREGKITLPDLQGGVFTISNGGVYGSLLSTPILNPPQSGILGMHSIQERPVALNGAVVIRPMMYLALSYDHRVVDGKEAVSFLIKVKQAIENPSRLLLEI